MTWFPVLVCCARERRERETSSWGKVETVESSSRRMEFLTGGSDTTHNTHWVPHAIQSFGFVTRQTLMKRLRCTPLFQWCTMKVYHPLHLSLRTNLSYSSTTCTLITTFLDYDKERFRNGMGWAGTLLIRDIPLASDSFYARFPASHLQLGNVMPRTSVPG